MRKAKTQLDHTLKRYGITADEYEMYLHDQENRCAICRKPSEDMETRRFSVDHCHKTGKVRGLLCTQCNFGIGQFKDSPRLLVLAAKYLMRP